MTYREITNTGGADVVRTDTHNWDRLGCTCRWDRRTYIDLQKRRTVKSRHAGPGCCNGLFGLSVVTRPSPDYVAISPSTTRRTTLPWVGLC